MRFLSSFSFPFIFFSFSLRNFYIFSSMKQLTNYDDSKGRKIRIFGNCAISKLSIYIQINRGSDTYYCVIDTSGITNEIIRFPNLEWCEFPLTKHHGITWAEEKFAECYITHRSIIRTIYRIFGKRWRLASRFREWKRNKSADIERSNLSTPRNTSVTVSIKDQKSLRRNN